MGWTFVTAFRPAPSPVLQHWIKAGSIESIPSPSQTGSRELYSASQLDAMVADMESWVASRP